MTKVWTVTGELMAPQSVHPSPTRTKVLMVTESSRSRQLEMARKVPTQFLQRWRQRQPSWESMWATQVRQAPGKQYQQVALIWASMTVAVALRLTATRASGLTPAGGAPWPRGGAGVSTRVPEMVRCAKAKRSRATNNFIPTINLTLQFRALQSLIKYRKTLEKIKSAFLYPKIIKVTHECPSCGLENLQFLFSIRDINNAPSDEVPIVISSIILSKPLAIVS